MNENYCAIWDIPIQELQISEKIFKRIGDKDVDYFF